MSVGRRAWPLFLVAAGVLVVALAASSVALIRGEHEDLVARATAEHEARLRDAASAMDRWIGPVLAREAGRHHADYASYRAPRRAFTPALERLPAGSVVEPSPLLGHSADGIALHVEWSPDAGARSPEVPTGRERELALSSGLSPEALRVAESRLAAIAARVDFEALARDVQREAPAAPAATSGTCLAADEVRVGPLAPALLEDAGSASVGPLVPRWLDDGGLVLARDVRAGDRQALQLVVTDWPALSSLLIEQCASDLPGARLVGADRARGMPLSTVPAVLAADPPAAAAWGWTPVMTRLALGWLAGLVSLGAIGIALRTTLTHADRRARFAAAVSHELRTPLTTLRMYSEMLADGVVTDPGARQEYLETIQAESARLASLVENVLLHARIEQASAPPRRRLAVGDLVAAVEPVLRRRADQAGRPLAVAVEDPSAEVEVDRDAVERVLFNLVDNACKHGTGATDPAVHVQVRRRAGFVDFLVSDSGPGIPRALGAAVFDAFRRGDETGAPGAGLGLALSRSLARDLRGELSLVPSDEGACFQLSLRLA